MLPLHSKFQSYKYSTVLPPNSLFLGPGIFREFEIHELIIHDFPPNSLYYDEEKQ